MLARMFARLGHISFLSIILSGSLAFSQPPAQPGEQAPPQDVVVRREALHLKSPAAYRATLQLKAAKQLQIVAAVNGVVQDVQVKTGDKVQSQSPLVQLTSTRQRLVVKRAEANVKLAQLELQQAQADKPLAQARLDAAEADLEIAKHDLAAETARAPFAGKIGRIHVVPGQFVRAGTALLTFYDDSQLEVEIPLDRAQAQADAEIDVRIESTEQKGRVVSIVPLPAQFASLRELAESVVSATVRLNNADGKLQVGQAVHSPLIPRLPIAEIPTTTLKNTGDGRRKVQIVRDHVIRDVVILELGQVGGQRIFVSGAFQPQDELVLDSTLELVDGTRLLPATTDAAAAASSPPNAPGRPGQPKRAGGF